MEILLGMILLLQVVTSIQIMLVRKQVLQQIGTLEKKVIETTESAKSVSVVGTEGTIIKETQHLPEYDMRAQTQELSEKTRAQASQETLLNEVLSEVFS